MRICAAARRTTRVLREKTAQNSSNSRWVCKQSYTFLFRTAIHKDSQTVQFIIRLLHSGTVIYLRLIRSSLYKQFTKQRKIRGGLDRPVSAARQKIHLTGRVIKEPPGANHTAPGGSLFMFPYSCSLFFLLLNFIIFIIEFYYRAESQAFPGLKDVSAAGPSIFFFC